MDTYESDTNATLGRSRFPAFLHSWKRAWNHMCNNFSPFEWVLLWVFVILACISGIALLHRANATVLAEIPASGGEITEGIVGSPRFINPLLAVSDADRDLANVVYAGLMKPTADGGVTEELAESVSISDDGRSYTFTLRSDATFHDGEPVTADDVMFTIEKARDPALKSPRRASWEGVSITKIDERTVQFTLGQPYAPFLENTTIGILPEHIWAGAAAEQFSFSRFNVEPIGAGPYQIADVVQTASGIPDRYVLEPNPTYVLGKPHISELTFVFYPNEESLIAAYERGDINHFNGVSPKRLRDVVVQSDSQIMQAPLPRVFAVFFNQNQADFFADESVRRALDAAIDKHAIVSDVLAGYGTAIDGPLPPDALPGIVDTRATNTPVATETSTGTPPRIERARELLRAGGWEQNEASGVFENEDGQPLTFSIATSDVAELQHAADIIAQTWNTVGAQVDAKVFEANDLNQNVIRPRQYQALLFGEVVGREPDLFAFWHSSQRNDPGLNVAMYANITADALLEEARAETDPQTRAETYNEFITELEKDSPAVFLYAPDFIYIVSADIDGVALGPVTTPSDRFANIHEWHTDTDRVWPLFIQFIKNI